MRRGISFVGFLRLLTLLYVSIFIIYPLAYFTTFVVSPENILEIIYTWTSDLFISSLWNSLLVSTVVTLLSILIGVPYAYMLHRYRIPGKRFILPATFLPTLIPPFVGALSFIYLFGRWGTVNLILIDYLKIVDRPVNFLYGLHGVIFVETITLFPWVAINVYSNLIKVDRSLEEASESLGATPIRRFLTITLPSMTPGILTSAFIVFSFSLTDYATPIIIGQYQLLAPQAFINIGQAINETRVRVGTYIVFFMLIFTLSLFLVVRRYISLREYASLRLPRPIEETELGGWKKIAVYAFIYFTIIFSLLPHIFIALISLSTAWSFTPLPTVITLQNFADALDKSYVLVNTALYSLIALLICFIIGSIGAYAISRAKDIFSSIIDSALSIMFVVPGIVVGVSYLYAFVRPPIPLIEAIGNTWLIMPLMLSARRIAYTVRYSWVAYLLVRTSLEEAAYVVGEKPFKTYMKIVLPNAVYGIFAGLMFSLAEIINELTASLFIYKPGWETITIRMFIEITAGRLPVAAAYAVFLLIISYIVAVMLMRIISK